MPLADRVEISPLSNYRPRAAIAIGESDKRREQRSPLPPSQFWRKLHEARHASFLSLSLSLSLSVSLSSHMKSYKMLP